MKRLLVLALVSVCAAFPVASVDGGQRQLRVGYLEWAGARNSPGIGRDLYSGFVRAVKDFGLAGTVRDLSPRDSPLSGIAYFVQHRYDLIVMGAVTPDIRATVSAAVARFPQTRFLLPDVTPELLPKQWKNVHGYGFRVEEASYLAGYLGALVERRRHGKHVVSSVGGAPAPQIAPFIAGYQAGAKKADPTVTTLNGYSGDFLSPPKCRTVALGQIARGSGVVFDIAGACGLGALAAAREKGVWGIGVDVDQSSLGPHILTSVLKNAGRAMYLELGAFKSGRLSRGGLSLFGLREGGVGLGKISPRVPITLIRRLDTIRAGIVAGKIHVPTRVS
jgi:basic membrane protein A